MFKRILTVTLAVILALETPLTAFAAQPVSVLSEENSGEEGGSTEGPGKEDGDQQEPENPGEAVENPQESENPGTEEDAPSENPGEGDEIPGEPVDNLPEEDIPSADQEEPEEQEEQEEAEITVSEDSVSQNTLSAAAFSVRASEKPTVTPLSFDAASNDGVQVTLPASTEGAENYVWYSFTAPKAGRYAFYCKEAVENSIYFYLCAAPDAGAVIRNGTPQTGVSLCAATNYMEEGETLYIGTYTGKQDGSLTYTLRAAYQTNFRKNSDGTYTAALPDGDSITLKARTGKSRYQLFAEKPSQKQYDLITICCPADHSEGDTIYGGPDRKMDTSKEGDQTASDTLLGGSYETACIVTRGTVDNKFAALLAGMDPFVIEGADSGDVVHVHNARCEKTSIELELESLVRDGKKLEIWCHAADSGEKIAETQVVDPWVTYKFEKLKPGTAYRFDIRAKSEDTIFKSLTYSTQALSEVIADARAEISQDFSELILQAKPSYQWTEGTGELHWEMTDSLGRRCSGTRKVKLDERDEQGYFTAKIDVVSDEIYLQPGAAYEIQVSMEFASASVLTQTKTIRVKAPEQAFLKESDITFGVRQEGRDAEGKPRVIVTVEVDGSAKIEKVCYFYRPVDVEENKYSIGQMYLKSGKAEESVYDLSSAKLGLDYEFILSVGGITKRVTLKIENELGVRLKRVEMATDETGPFHFVRTYEIDGKDKLTGSYYLQAYPLTLGSSQAYYEDKGKSVELNQKNGYRVTVSTLDLGWVTEPDIDYYLRWVLSKTETVTYNENLLAVAHESLHTGKPKMKLEKKSGSHDYQSFQVTLGEEDAAVLKGHGIKVPIYCYLREKGAKTFTQTYFNYVLSPEDDYSRTVAFSGLKTDTEYEFSLRDRNGNSIYAKEIFRTGKDTRSVTISKTEVYVEEAKLYYTLSGFDYYTKDYVVCWYRQAGIAGAWKKSNAYQATKDGCFTLTGLKENKAYEYAVGIGGQNDEVLWLKKTVKGNITTKIDTRHIEVSAKTRMTSAKLTCQMYEMGVTGNNIVMFFWREKGQNQWEKKEPEQYFSNEAEKILSFEGLKEDTVYEYLVGFAKKRTATAADLQRVTEGEFRTAADRRSVKAVSEPRAYSARIQYTLSDMEGADDGWLLGYFRKAADAGDAAWKKAYVVKTGEDTAEDSFLLADLEEETAYELTMGFGTKEDAAFDGLKRTETLSFATKPDSRSLSEAVAEVTDANVTLRVKFAGNVERHASHVHFFYRVKGETAYQKAGRVVDVSSVEEETAAVTFSMQSLLKETEYEFAAVLTNDGKCDKPEDVTRDAYKVSGSFTTPEAVKPTKLKISKEQLYLNANATYKNEPGFGCETLKVQWEPLTANADLVWESSDKAVATVSKDGKVSAKAAGTAAITATSAYAPEVFVSCEVTVGDYQIGRKGADGSVSPVEGAKLTAARGVSCEGYVLCKTAGGNLEEVTDAEVVSSNDSIARWTDGVIETKRAGETRLVFTSEADQVQTFLTVSVQPAAGKGFAITGFTSDYYKKAYPALRAEEKDSEGREQYTMALVKDIIYTAEGEIMPSRPGFDSGDFNWSIDKTEVASVDENGKVTPHKAGDAVLRVEPKNADDSVLYKMQVFELALHIKEMPPQGNSFFYALENTHKKLGDVKFAEGWEGWKWKSPDTPIVINGENRTPYLFLAVYQGETYYPHEMTVRGNIGRVTGITACEKEDGNHNHVLEVGGVDGEGNPAEGSDSLTLCVESLFRGDINRKESLNYTWKVEMNAPAGLVVKEGETKKLDGRLAQDFTVTAVKKGSYTLTPVIKVTDFKTKREKVLAKTSFKIQAVEGKQAYLTLTPEETAGVQIEEGGRIVVDHNGNVKTFRVQAALRDRNSGEDASFKTVKLTWSSSDKKVVTVKASKDTHSAEIKIVGEGHAILTAKVKDKAGHTGTAQVEIRNRAPRVDVSKVTVNPAYDFESEEGRRLACENGGAVEIVPAYNVEKLATIRLWKNDTKTPVADNMTLETDLELVSYAEGGQYKYLIRPKESAKDKVYECYLGVESSDLAEPFFHPLRVTVKTKQPQVTVRSVRSANLFYRTDPASVDISTAQKGVMIESVKWIDSAEGEGHGFASAPSAYMFDTTKKGNNVERLYFAQEDIRLTDGKKLTEPGIVSGNVEIRWKGYRDPVEKPVSLKWNYKKPTVVVKEKQATLIPSLEDHGKGSFLLYNGDNKRFYFKTGSNVGNDDPRVCYHELTFLNQNFKKTGNRDYTYVGSKTKGSEKLTMTIVSGFWREPLTAVHTVKLVNPTPYLTKPKLVINTGHVSTAYTDIELKNAYTAALSCDDIVIEGKNTRSQALLDQDILEMEQDSARSNRIVVRANRARTMGQDAVKAMKNGTYDFKVTPCYRDASGNRIKGKTIPLKIQVTGKAVTAKVKVSGSLDLSKKPNVEEGETDRVKNYVSIWPAFQNIGENYAHTNSFALLGEYSNYFRLVRAGNEYRIRINGNAESRLKAGQRYRLAIRFKLQLENGDTVQVQSPTFTIRPKQSVPKVTVHGNAQTLYAGKDTLVRTCGFELPAEMGYRINAISGGLDCNKDGKQDITLTWVKADSTDHYAAAQIKLADRDGALTVSGMKGKTYTVPVTITLKGRDGLSKDIRTNIKVTVRR